MGPLMACSVAGVLIGVVGLVASFVGPRTGLVNRVAITRATTIVHRREAIVAVVLAITVGLLTHWPVAGLSAGAAALTLPRALKQTSARKTTERVEAIASWTELLRDTLAASAGLDQAIIATASVAPEAIRDPVHRMSGRLSNGMPLSEALFAFAVELNDPAGDMVVSALLLTASSRSSRLVDLLGSLAHSIREEVSMRLRVEASRSSSKSGVRTVIVFSICFAVALAALAHGYLAPYRSPTGQLVLSLVAICYFGGISIMIHLVRPQQPIRILSPEGLK